MPSFLGSNRLEVIGQEKYRGRLEKKWWCNRSVCVSSGTIEVSGRRAEEHMAAAMLNARAALDRK